MRYLLLFKHKAGILPSPPTQPLDRENDLPNMAPSDETASEATVTNSGVWRGPRTGKFVQALGGSSKNERAWQRRHQPSSGVPQPPSALKSQQVAGEAVYIARPLVHRKLFDLLYLLSLYYICDTFESFDLDVWPVIDLDVWPVLISVLATSYLRRKQSVFLCRA